jgi:hypothetical protein
MSYHLNSTTENDGNCNLGQPGFDSYLKDLDASDEDMIIQDGDCGKGSREASVSEDVGIEEENKDRGKDERVPPWMSSSFAWRIKTIIRFSVVLWRSRG